MLLFRVHSQACNEYSNFYLECLNSFLRNLVFVDLAIWVVGSSLDVKWSGLDGMTEFTFADTGH